MRDSKPEHLMFVVLNKGAGTLKGSDHAAIQTQVKNSFGAAGHEATVTLCDGSELRAIISRLAKSSDVETIVVGGGDGSISASAAELVGTGKALGVLPLGTMNFFARALQIPLNLDSAIESLANAQQRLVDIGRFGGHVFLHQVAFGLPPRLVQLREKMVYGSRMGKMLANLRAFFLTLRSPPLLTLEVRADGDKQIVRTAAFVISNNLYGDSHLPYPDRLDEGVLGLYACKSNSWADLAKLGADVVLGNWRNNPNVETHKAREVMIGRAFQELRRLSASVDGELIRFRGQIKIETVPRCLKVLVPVESDPGPG